ncbi:hypothetical protein SERLA73DRAFT_112057 [Serpula lacrymans var. lacrymans S7.3]|uniref:PIN domain-containing protein n=1 Tax=Serpula lacrymans var. lacrymans (strain S7.3) TaxID=936435 RepID=F8Q5X1_SERL3|nr:hypothetical protein SERLA73DRAFT_112057 [Serpula lacrymans var. lacrymans S7.3]
MVQDVLQDPQKSTRKAKDRDGRDPAQPTDLVERMIAFQRKNAAATRPRDRTERAPPPPLSRPLPAIPSPAPVPPRTFPVISSPRRNQQPPHLVVSRPEADPEDFSRRLKISTSSRPSYPKQHQQQSKLFNPDTDPIPMRRTAEPESISDATSSSYVPRSGPPTSSHQREPPTHQRQLFDHRKDDPVRFSVLARPSSSTGRPTPTPKSSGDYVSASSTSSYAHSMTSSNFTLSSNTTDTSSASSALFDRKPNEESSNNAFAVQLKRLYRGISVLETKILNEDTDDQADESRVMLHGHGKDVPDDDLEQQKWRKLISDHKRLAEMMHNLMEISLAPSVPASLRVIPTKYNIIIRLWTHAFHKLLESLRRASFTSSLALEHLQDFIYYAYTFYTGLLEEPTLRSFKAGWLEALGDLARYRMAVAVMVTNNQVPGGALTTAAVSKAAEDTVDIQAPTKSQASVKSSSDRPAARIDDSPSPSVGIVAARLLDVEPEKERWRGIAREWYAQGLADTPGTGKLHHHLGLLSREVESEELRSVYHFVKSMTTLHPFSTSRESILPIWSSTAQSRRSQPDARAPELFVLLHGMLFTNIQLDDFQPTLARFLERLQIEGAEEREWIIMAIVNIGAILEYGKPSGLIRKAGGTGTREPGGTPLRVVAKRAAIIEEDNEEKRMDVDEEGIQASPVPSEAGPVLDHPLAYKMALELSFSMLSFVLRNPMRKASPFARSSLNPYLPILLTFISTIVKNADTLSLLERAVPWNELARFFASIPRNVMTSQGLLSVQVPGQMAERWTMLTSGCAPPLPEDWCLRGMEWVGRRVFERGYWKAGEDRRAEIEVLDIEEGGQLTDGIIEDGDDEEDGAGGTANSTASVGDTSKRWVRVVRCAIGLSQAVDGFTWVEGTREWRVDGTLEAKVRRWEEEDKLEREEEERRRSRKWLDDSMDIDEDEDEDELATMSSEESQDDEEDSEEIRALKARRRYARSLIQSEKHGSDSAPKSSRKSQSRRLDRTINSRPLLHVVPGYTVLVVDTNILLSSLSIFSSIIETLRWTVVLPVPVIMELDGLSSNSSQLGGAAQEALSYITSHFKTHSMSLKVQTSRGNYLTSLSVRSEQVDFADRATWERNMDDLILKAAIWQDEHWVDRSALLKPAAVNHDTTNAVKVVLLSLDRNLRLKARSRQLSAASEKDLAHILVVGS